MKRDARIGLAVVLVLGLMVTLLVGRALYKRGATQPAEVDELAQGDAGSYSSEPVRAPGTETPASPSAAPANVNVTPPTLTPAVAPAPHAGDTAARMPEPINPALDRFVTDERRNIPQPAVSDATAHAATPPAAQPHATAPVAPTAGDHSAATPSSGNGWEDHESTAPSVSDSPSDGFGYTVAPGDNMWKISAKVYGDGKYTQKIVEANSHTDTQKLKVGSVIHIPAIPHKTILMKLPSFADAQKESAGSAAAPSAVAAHSDKKKTPDTAKEAKEPAAASAKTAAPDKSDTFAGATHKVEAGETLSTIATKYYGTGGPKSVARILAANKGLDPAKLKVGQEIEIPAKK